MAMDADKLYDEIIQNEKDYTKTFLSNDDPSISDNDLVNSGKCRIVFDGENKVLNYEAMKSANYMKVLGDTIIAHVKENAEFEWSYDGTINYIAGTSTSIATDKLKKVQGKIKSIENIMKQYYNSVPDFLAEIVKTIRTAVIDLTEPDIFFIHQSMDEFADYNIVWSPNSSGGYEDNMKTLAKAIIQYTKTALSTMQISCTHTDLIQYPTAISSSGTAKMTKIL